MSSRSSEPIRNESKKNNRCGLHRPCLPLALSIALLMGASPLFCQTQQIVKRPKIGVAFEGGGALGLGHIGVIEWLEQHHIPVDYIAGTSMGGLVGGLYATGKSPTEIRDLIRSIDWDEVLNGQLPYTDLAFRRKEDRRSYPTYIEFGLKHGLSFPGGLNAGQQVKFILDRAALPYSNIKSFDELPIPFRCVATEMNTGTAHVFKDGSLSEALRATMSLPAIFTPVKTDDGKLYVDGGLLNNLPVDVVKSMGADVVIAIYLATAPFDAKAPQSLFSMMGSSLAVMIAANERRNMEAADILVTVDLVGYTAMNYNSGDKIADKGVEGAEKKARMLSTLSVDDNTWQEYIAQRSARRITKEPAVQFVEVRGTSPRLQTDLEKLLDKFVGQVPDNRQIERDLTRIAGMGRFSTLSYELTQRDGKEGLLIEAQEKSYAPPTILPGFFLDGADYQNVQINVGGRITLLDFGGFRSEWRTDVSLLSTYGITSEYYHPFHPESRWFYAPRIQAVSYPLNLYRGNKEVAEYRIGQFGGGFDFGYAINRDSEFRVGYSAVYETGSLRIGAPDVNAKGGRLSGSSVRYTFDGTDSPLVPRSGTLVNASFQYRDSAPGAPSGFPVAQLSALYFKPITKPASVFVTASGGTTFGHNNTGLPPFFLGGPLRLGAYGTNEILTNQYFLFRAGYLREIGRINPLLGDKIYAIGFYEIAKPYGGYSPSKLPNDVNAGLIVDTLLGPVLIGGAWGDTGHHKIYFELGRIF